MQVKDDEWKMYPHHKFSYPGCGNTARKKLDNVFNHGGDLNAITLSYFSRPGTTV